ncbi:FAD-binding domain [Frigidibacter sp. ROC022]|uniref:FAD-binding domain n=1 Tax=Frigidibacter sp. ROC022 TaxID=2971796 RepID=UPI00215ACD5F|nr:FAD-binding domain [Frigidibacter sp. ROC022]MCR8723878.1 FAD-binding domain [Frigidibacter sp. ROC022]
MRIAVNGCGIAGPALAWWLRRHGMTPVIFEQAPALRRGGYVIDFWGSGYAVAERMGLIPDLLAEGYVMQRLRSVTRTGRTSSSVDASLFGKITGGRYMSLERSALSARLVSACDGIEIRYGQPITGIAQDVEGVTVRSAAGEERFDLAIGADGLHSALRGMVFGPQETFEKRLGYGVAAFTLPGYRPREDLAYVQHTQPGRQVSRVALRGDLTLILVIFAAHFLESWPKGLAEEKAALARVCDGMGWEVPAILKALDKVDEVYFDRVSQIRMDHWAEGRVALLGDAAACPSLLAGEGSGLAMTSAYVLAGELKRAGGDHGAAFAAWQARMADYTRGKQDMALRFAGFFAPKNRLTLILRDAMLLLTRVPGLARPLLGSGLTRSMELPDY